MSGFDKLAFVRHLRANALPLYGKGKCAQFVREALEAGGLDTKGNPFSAKDYGPFLRMRLFQQISTVGYTPQVGDIVVIAGTRLHPNGHIQGWDGTQWISDFKQPRFYPAHNYEQPPTPYAIYRRS